jgi:hypothetical protein
MATGQKLQLTKQIGEYLVAAELCRLDLIATTFTGNVPDYDIVAISREGRTALVQVKAINGGSWQFSDARVFLRIKQEGKTQVPSQVTAPKYPDLVCVFVLLDEYGKDRFFVLPWVELQRIVARRYRANIKRLGGIRPRRHDSYHAALKPSDLAEWKGRWKVVKDAIA